MSSSTLVTWPRRLVETDAPAAAMIAAAVLLPLVAVLQPPQPVQALAAVAVLLALPGLALTRLLRLEEPLLATAFTVAASCALTVLVSTALFYASVWSWQAVLVLLGLVTVLATAVGLSRSAA